ncbi:MAG: MarR family transcriptional regulator [bacterium]|nr:MarR family transcriptional regulator [bacterium]
MSNDIYSSDITILDLLRKHGGLTVGDLAAQMDVTATAIRQRLARLSGQELIERSTEKAGRGRPTHRYSLTTKGRRKTGSNFADLAIALWEEIREIKDPEIRRGLLVRLSRRLAEAYTNSVEGDTVKEKMDEIVALFRAREIPFEVNDEAASPVLTALACPYPDLAEQDRTICSVEKLLFSELLGESVTLSQCRLDGDNCCTFELKQIASPTSN